MLQQALEALVKKTIEKPDQIVVVNGGDERADLVVRDYAILDGIDIDLVRTVNKNLATSRNVGLRFCRGDIIAMTDDDAEVYPDWIAQIKALHKAYPDVAAIGGAIVGASSDTSFVSRLADIVTFPSPAEPTYVRNAPGVNVSYKRNILQRVGCQDEALFRGEDVDFNWRISLLGGKILYHPALKVIHHHRPTFNQFLRQHYMYGRAYYLVRAKWPEMYCIYPRSWKRPKDYLKAAHCIVAILYQPVLAAARLPHWRDRILAVPALIANQIVWWAGVLYQKYFSVRKLRG